MTWAFDLAAPRETGRLRGCAIDVHLSAAIARPFLIPIPTGLSGSRDVMRLAMELAHETLESRAPCVVWLEARHANRSLVAVAMDEQLRDELERRARERGLKLTALRPWWAAVQARMAGRLSGPALVLIEEPGLATLVADDGQQIVTAESWRDGGDSGNAIAAARRMAVSSGLMSAPLHRVWMLPSSQGEHAASVHCDFVDMMLPARVEVNP